MHLLIDVDGVLADQVTPVLKKINSRYGLNLTKEDIRRWDQAIGPTDIKTEIEASQLDPEFVLKMEPIEGALIAVAELSRGHTITIATNRAVEASEPTKQWLALHSIPYDDFLNTGIAGKGAQAGDVLIDDYPVSVLDFSSEGKFAIVFTQPWNLDDETLAEAMSRGTVARAKDWSQVVELVNSND